MKGVEYCLWMYCFLVPWWKPITVSFLGLNLPVGPLDVLAVPATVILLWRWRSIRLSVPVCALAAYVLALFISLVSVSDPQVRVQALLRVMRFAEMALPFFLASTLSFDRKVSQRLMTLFAIGGGISVLLGIGMWLFSDVLLKTYGIVPYTASVYRPDPLAEGGFVRIVHVRASGVLGDYMAYGHLIATWTVVSLGAVIPLRFLRNVLWSSAIWGVGGGALLLSLTRGALLNLASAVGPLFLLFWSSRWRQVIKRELTIVLVLAVVATSLFLVWRPADLVNRVDAFGRRLVAAVIQPSAPVDPGMASIGRVDLWTSYASLFWERPVTGIGYKTLWLQRSIPPDNSYLGALVETGVLGFACLCVFIFSTLRGLIAASRSYLQAVVPFCAWLGTLTMGLICDVFTFWGTVPALLAITGTALSARWKSPPPPLRTHTTASVSPDKSHLPLSRGKKTMMRLLHIIADGAPGGGTTFVLSLMEDLKRDGQDVGFVTEADSYALTEARRLGISATGINFFESRLDLRVSLEMRRLIDRFQPDLIHVHGARAGFFFSWVRAGKKSRPVVYTVHGYHFPHKRWGVRHLGALAERQASGRADVTVFVSHYDRALSERLALVPEDKPAIVIHNGVRPDSVPGRAAVDPWRLGFLGRITAQKDPLLFVEMVRLLAGEGYQGTIIGGGDMEEEVRSRINECGIEKDLNVLGLLPRDAALAQAASLGTLVLTSRWEGLPIVLLEAALMGIPVVAADVGGVSEVIEHGSSGLLVKSRDPADFAAAVRRITTDVGLRERIVARARSRVMNGFLQSGTTDGYLGLYRWMLGGGHTTDEDRGFDQYRHATG